MKRKVLLLPDFLFPALGCSSSLFDTKILPCVTKSLHQDSGLCYLHLPFFFLYIHYPFLQEDKKLLWSLFFSANLIADYSIVIYILPDYSSVRIGFNMNNKCLTLPIAVCNFWSMKSLMELNSVSFKFFCYVTWSDKRQHWRPCKQDVFVKPCCFLATIGYRFKNCKLIVSIMLI